RASTSCARSRTSRASRRRSSSRSSAASRRSFGRSRRSSPPRRPGVTRRSRSCRTRRTRRPPTATPRRTQTSFARGAARPRGARGRGDGGGGGGGRGRAARLSGSRFGFLVGDTALLALALYRFALDIAGAHGHIPVVPPVLVREEAMYGTGFFPTDRSNIYAL